MKWIISAAWIFLSLNVFAQKDSTQKVVSLNLHYGQIYVHSVSVRNVKGAKPFQAELEISRQRLSQKVFEQCNCYPKTGFQVSYINFGTSILGEGIAASHFLEPQYKLSQRVQFRIKASIGAIYLTKPYDLIKNPTNNSYAIRLNPYFNLGWGFSFNLNKHLNLGTMGFFHHTSNGGVKEPNRGVNWLTGALSLQYSPVSTKLPTFRRSYERYWKGKPPKFEVGMFYSPHQGFNSRQRIERNYVIGGFAQATKQVGRISGIIAGAEVYYNSFAQHIQPLSSVTVIAVQGGHVFLLNRASLSTQIGVDLLNKTATKTIYFTRWAFSYRVTDHVKLGLSLKAQSDYADFADVRISYVF